MRLLLATTNAGKVTEMREALNGLGLEFLSLADVPTIGSADETGVTYAENATIKARHAFAATGYPIVADDSGIHIDALENELGIHTRRWGAGPLASDEEWIEYFLSRMKKESNKRARFVCTLAHIDADGALHLFEGTCEGVITPTLEADYLPGLPLSACFKPDGENAVFSALPIEQKNSTSHRGRALSAFREFLASRQ